MSSYTLTPSSTRVNEGDTLTTTISTTDVIKGTTLYYRVVGKGIKAKDFSSGALKGTLKVGTDGTATLAHIFKNDNTTEGSESLTVQVFSDKKRKNLVGTGDAVTIADTSVKAVKGGGSSGTGQTSASGLSMEIDGITLVSGQTYTHETQIGRSLLRLGQNGLATDGNGTRLATMVDPITGYRTLDSLPAGASYKWKFEFNQNYLVGTAQFANGSKKTTGRVVWAGSNSFTGGKLSSFNFGSVGSAFVDGLKPSKAYFGNTLQLNAPKTRSAPFAFREIDSEDYMFTVTSEYSGVSSNANMPGVQAFAGGKFFYNGWNTDPFAANLL